jgi:hypothetical protein
LRILAILGDSTGLNLNADKETLKSFPAEIEILEQPTREDCDRYLADEHGWDILCFSGHGCIWRKANMFVGAKHDRIQHGIIINNLYAVMLRPPQK